MNSNRRRFETENFSKLNQFGIFTKLNHKNLKLTSLNGKHNSRLNPTNPQSQLGFQSYKDLSQDSSFLRKIQQMSQLYHGFIQTKLKTRERKQGYKI